MRKKTAFCILTLLGLLTACQQTKGPVHTVVVMHAYDETGQEGKPFQQYMTKAFRKEGLRTDIHHIYLNVIHEPLDLDETDRLTVMADQLDSWKPEIILINDDAALDFIYKLDSVKYDREGARRLKQYTDSLPAVAAGQTCLELHKISNRPNMTAFEDRPRMSSLLRVINQITGKQQVYIDMKHSNLGSRMREELDKQLSDTKYFLNNGNWEYGLLSDEELAEKYPGKILVNFVNSVNPLMNIRQMSAGEEADSLQDLQAEQNFRQLMRQSKKGYSIQVKYDLSSNTLIKHGGHPQFTTIHNQFGDERAMIVGGYFSSMETQITDQVGYAARILRGADPRTLPVKRHRKNYYMDYRAMKRFYPKPLKYSDWSGQFIIINAPFRVAYPVVYWSALLILVLGGLFLLRLGFSFLISLYNRRDIILLHKLRLEDERQRMTLASAKAGLWYYEKGYIRNGTSSQVKNISRSIPVDEFEKMVLDDSKASFQVLRDFAHHPGRNKLRLHLQYSKDEEPIWLEMSYNVDRDNILNDQVMGIGVRIDDVVEQELQMQAIQQEINESEQKQNFLNNISHDLRTPLGAVTGFAQLMTSEGMDFSNEEMQTFSQAIHENAEMMTKMMQSVIEQSQSSHAEMIIKPLRTSVQHLVKQVFHTHQVLVPSHLELRMEQDKPDRAIWIDPNRTRQVLNNFVGNAFKFTPQGSITIGWKYLPQTQEVWIYCRDTGIGLSEESCLHVFERFYKEKEQANGTGLGLNISKQIIEDQEGTIGVDSQLGKGSTFWCKFKEYNGQ